MSYVVPISAVIVGLLVLVALSYRQTVFAYPNGGGSYTVAKDNLGTMPGLIAAAALLTDYILTVSVSISSGVAAITSAYPNLFPYTVSIGIGAIFILMLVNLRGVRESGIAFSVPTYIFIVLMLALIATGVYRGMTGSDVVAAAAPVRVDPFSARHGEIAPMGLALIFLVLRAFAEGCVAMTGTEAISNGVGAFKTPSSRNAAITLGWMAAILAAFFMGTSYLARHYQVMPTASETVLSQLGRHIFGTGWLYFALQYATFAILVLAANTAFADFPRLSSILARDGYMPRQFAARGDRLAFSNGIIALSLLAMLLLRVFHGDTSALIPLYAIGVFVCFTLSQAGMVVHWFRSREPGWRWKAWLNGLGAVATAVVSIVQVLTKFVHGAWIVVVIIPMIIILLRRIHRHYEHFGKEIAYKGHAPLMFLHHTVIVPVNGITKPVAGALVYATTISEDVRAVYVEVDSSHRGAVATRVDRVGHRRRHDRDSLAIPFGASAPRRLRGRTGGARRSGSRHDRRAGDRPAKLVGTPPAQQDGAVHQDGVSFPAERGRDSGSVSRRTVAKAARPRCARRAARRAAGSRGARAARRRQNALATEVQQRLSFDKAALPRLFPS